MAAHEHLNPTQLRDHVRSHLKNWPESYDTPDCANGNCWHATRGYIGSAVEAGHEAIFQTHEVPDDVHVSHHPTHTVAQVQTSRGPYVVDLTHRQFDAKAPYPLIEPIHKFLGRKTMKPFRYVDEFTLEDLENLD